MCFFIALWVKTEVNIARADGAGFCKASSVGAADWIASGFNPCRAIVLTRCNLAITFLKSFPITTQNFNLLSHPFLRHNYNIISQSRQKFDNDMAICYFCTAYKERRRD